MPKISVIVPVYNVEKYINKCVDSIISQTYTDLEIILVDDGSPDNCGEICDEYAKKESRIKVIHKKNGGLSDARNAGLDIAKGEWIGFVDSDDYIEPDMYEKLLSSAKKYNADLSICSCRYFGDKEYDNTTPIKDGVLSGKDILFKKMNEKKAYYWVTAWSKLYKREIFNELRFPYGKLHEDEFVIHKILYNTEKVACVSDMLYNYLQRDSSIVNSEMTVRHLDLAQAQLERAEYYMNNSCDNGRVCSVMFTGMMTAVSRYRKCKNQTGAKERFTELKNKYRTLLKSASFKGVSPMKKLRAYFMYLAPFLFGTVLEKITKRK